MVSTVDVPNHISSQNSYVCAHGLLIGEIEVSCVIYVALCAVPHMQEPDLEIG